MSDQQPATCGQVLYYLDNDTCPQDEAARNAIRDHLERCHSCSEAVRDMARVCGRINLFPDEASSL